MKTVLLYLAAALALAIGIPVLFFLVLMLTQKALAHDHYGNVYKHNLPLGQPRALCCGGDPEKGDCEPLTEGQINYRADGVEITSKRYGKTIFIPEHEVEWGPPVDGITGALAFPNDPYAGHWCGKARALIGNAYATVPDKPTVDQPDPVYWTFCAFIKAGGV